MQVPEGWAFSSADFSINCLDFMRPGNVMMTRVGRNRSAWYALDEAGRGNEPLFVIGSGFTVQEAIADAIANIHESPTSQINKPAGQGMEGGV